MRVWLLTAILAGWMIWPLRASAETDSPAVAFVREVGNEMPGVLANAATVQQRRARLLPFVSRVVDVDAVAQYCLGRYWGKATPAQQQSFQSLFLTVLVNEIALWTGGKEGSGDETSVVMHQPIVAVDATYVPTTVKVGEAPAADITWVVNMQSKPPKILDVTAGGISLRETQRSDYTSYLYHHHGDVGGLIDVLQQRARDAGALPAPADALKHQIHSP